MKSNNQTDLSEETPDKNSPLFCLGKKLNIVKLYQYPEKSFHETKD